MRTLTKAILPLCLLLTFAGAAAAQTPDGSPPSQETVCDGETGAAYGLCNAYCEAMDCDSEDPQASETACTKVRGKFQNITGHDLPCGVPATCPCNDVPGPFQDIVAGELGPITSCTTPAVIGYSKGVMVQIPGIASNFTGSYFGTWYCGEIEGGINLQISPAQAQVCADLLEQAAASYGVTCP